MRSSMMALAVAAALAGCSTGDANVFASRDKTVEYYRVFDIKTDPGNPAVVKAASAGISRHVADATLATPAMASDLQEHPGHFKLAEPNNPAPGAAGGRAPICEGASWTAKAAPRVNGGDNMNMVACLFPYKNGYHLDMYAVFTEKEGGWLEWPRRFTGKLMGTPETWTDQTMVDVVRAIRDTTGAQVALVEAKPALPGTPWLEMAPNTLPAAAPAATPAAGATAVGSSGAGNGSTASTSPASTSPASTSPASTSPVPAPGTAAAADTAPAAATGAAGGSASAAGASSPAASGAAASGTSSTSGTKAGADPAIGTVATGTSGSTTTKQGLK